MIQKFREVLPVVDASCFIADGSAVIGDVVIGKNSSIWHNAVLRGDVDQIVIGEGSNVQECSVLHCTTGMKINIGNYVTIGHGVILHSCEIGDGSLVGMGAVVLDGAKIGKHCLIGAGALITPHTIIPDGTMVLGSPAKAKRSLDKEEIEGMMENAMEYVKLAKEYQKSK